MSNISRRQMISGLVTGAAAMTAFGAAQAAEEAAKKQGKKRAGKKATPAYMKYKNEDFYKADGTFDVDKAKQAYYEMMAAFRYPVVPRLKTDEFWAVDFGMGKFLEVGMAGIFWVNNQADDYFGHEIYLLPGQMIPEHKHVKTDGARPKMEAWQVRHGMVHIYGEGEATAGVEERIPPSHKECCVARTEQKLMPGEVGMLNGAEKWHWMRAGEKGAIVTEYASYHDGTALRFSNPDVKF